MVTHGNTSFIQYCVFQANQVPAVPTLGCTVAFDLLGHFMLTLPGPGPLEQSAASSYSMVVPFPVVLQSYGQFMTATLRDKGERSRGSTAFCTLLLCAVSLFML